MKDWFNHMVIKKDFYFLSDNKKTKIHGVIWKPEGVRPYGVIQLIHGMIEHIGRYDEFARYLAEQGFIVIGHDHLGHGQSIIVKEDRGYFSKDRGYEILINDINVIKETIKEEYPDLPYFMLGHSMGSFILRNYIALYGNDIDGAIIMGTGSYPMPLLLFIKLLIKSMVLIKGWRYRSKFLHWLTIGKNDLYFKKKSDPTNSWFSKNKENVVEFLNDSNSRFMFTLNGLSCLYECIQCSSKSKNINKIPKELPLLLVAGKDDPVGNFGKGVLKAYNQYEKSQIEDVVYKIYEKDRHEIIHELDREMVFNDIVKWIKTKL